MVRACGLIGYTGPAKPAATRLRTTVAADAGLPARRADDRDRGRLQDVARRRRPRRSRSRSSKRSRAAALSCAGSSISSSAGLGANVDGEAGVAQHRQHAVVVGVHDRRQRRDPGGLRELRPGGRASASPIPRPCHASATAKASSARSPVGSGTKHAWATTCAVGAGGRDEADAVVDEPARRARRGDAAAQEAKPARVGRQPLQEGRHRFDVGGRRWVARGPWSRRAGRRRWRR